VLHISAQEWLKTIVKFQTFVPAIGFENLLFTYKFTTVAVRLLTGRLVGKRNNSLPGLIQKKKASLAI
jgi:hypothetical protein